MKKRLQHVGHAIITLSHATTCMHVLHAFMLYSFRTQAPENIYLVWLLTIQNRQLFTGTFYSVHIAFCHICVRCSFMQRNRTKCTHYDQSQRDKLRFIPCQFFCLQAVYFLVVLSMRWWNNICLAIINNNNEHILYEICWLFSDANVFNNNLIDWWVDRFRWMIRFHSIQMSIHINDISQSTGDT